MKSQVPGPDDEGQQGLPPDEFGKGDGEHPASGPKGASHAGLYVNGPALVSCAMMISPLFFGLDKRTWRQACNLARSGDILFTEEQWDGCKSV